MQDKKQSLVPELRFPGFEGDWEVKSLGEIGSTYAGLSGKSKEDFVNGNAQYITFLNVLNNVVIDNTNHPTVKIKENENQNDVKYGDLLFNTSSETPEEVGFCAMMQDNKPNIYLNSFCFGYRFNVLKDYQPLFLAYYFRSSYGRRLMTKLAQGVTRYNLSKSNFLKAEIAFPSLPEQQKIAECLSSVDNLIQAEADQLQALKDHKKGLMQQLFPQEGKTTPKLRFPGFKGEWEEKKLGDISERVSVGLATSVTPYYRDKGVVMFRNLNIKPDELDDSDILFLDETFANMNQSKKIHTGDVLTVHTGYVGISCVVPAKYDGALTFTTLVTTTKKHIINPRFLCCFLNSSEGANAIESLQAGGGRNNLNVNDFVLLRVPIPPTIDEQLKIVDCLSSLNDQIFVESAKVEALREHKKGLMQKLFPTIN